MRRRCAIALALAAGAMIVFSASASSASPRAQLTRFDCQHALDPPNRAVSVNAVMRPLPDTRKLAVKFALLETPAGSAAPHAVVGAGDLGVWLTPRNPTLGQLPGDVWKLRKSVYNLHVPARYRFSVTFRWTGAHGRVLGTAVRLSAGCRERELRPDLSVEPITVSSIAGRPDKALYTAVIVNLGATAAGQFEVLFAPGDSSAPKTRTVLYLGAYQSRSELFTGPSCNAAGPPTVTVDATAAVDDYNRDNNQVTAVCPASPVPGPSPARR